MRFLPVDSGNMGAFRKNQKGYLKGEENSEGNTQVTDCRKKAERQKTEAVSKIKACFRALRCFLRVIFCR